ncbi:hypothetical protein Hanom_Chr08g00748301 [Helianthus anomalus]
MTNCNKLTDLNKFSNFRFRKRQILICFLLRSWDLNSLHGTRNFLNHFLHNRFIDLSTHFTFFPRRL